MRQIPTLSLNLKCNLTNLFRTHETVNPATEKVICTIPTASSDDVNRAVKAAKKAFDKGEWRLMSARDRGKKLLRLAELMEEHKVYCKL